MDVKAMSSEELSGALRDLLAGEVNEQVADLIREILNELRSRDPEITTEELEFLYPIYLRVFHPHSQADLIDVTGTKLTPSYHGKECLGNGSWVGYECCCDECDFYLECFPEARGTISAV